MRSAAHALLFILAAFQLNSANASPRILLITGGHSYDTTAFVDLFHSLQGITFDTISYPRSLTLLQSDSIQHYDVLVHYHYYPDLPKADSSIFLELCKKGIPMLFLHHSICTFQEWDGYMQMVGGKYVMPEYATETIPPSDYRHDLHLQVELLNPAHQITQGVRDFSIIDEGYTHLLIREDIYPLLRTNHPQCSPLIGWINYFHASTIEYLIFGHDHKAYENPEFRLLLQNSVFWLANQNRRSVNG